MSPEKSKDIRDTKVRRNPDMGEDHLRRGKKRTNIELSLLRKILKSRDTGGRDMRRDRLIRDGMILSLTTRRDRAEILHTEDPKAWMRLITGKREVMR